MATILVIFGFEFTTLFNLCAPCFISSESLVIVPDIVFNVVESSCAYPLISLAISLKVEILLASMWNCWSFSCSNCDALDILVKLEIGVF